jgi:shikimate kinase
MDRPRASRHVCIVGLMGVGKSTVAHLVADRLERPVKDSDLWIETHCRESGREIAERDGVAALHAIEATMLEEALAAEDPAIITPGASVVDDQRSRRLLDESAFVVWLDLDPIIAFERSQSGSHRRSVTMGDFRHMDRRRRGAFAAVADLRLDARRPPEELADEITSAFQSSSSS